MFTKKTYKFLGQHFKIASALLVLPFDWDVETQQLSVIQSKFRLAVVYWNMLASFGPTLTIYKVAIPGILHGGRDLSYLVVDILFLITFTLQIFFQWALVTRKGEIAHLINSLLHLDKKLTRTYCTPEKKPEDEKEDEGEENQEEKEEGKEVAKTKKKVKKEVTDGCDDNVFASLYMMFVYAALAVSLFWKHPENPRYGYIGLVQGLGVEVDSDQGRWLQWAWAVVEYFHLVKFCFYFNNAFYLLILYAHCTNFWLFQLSRPKVTEGEVRVIVKQPTAYEAIPNYKAQQVLNLQFNECCSRMLLPAFKVLNILLHTMATYVTISFRDRIPLGGYLIFPIGFVMWCTIESDVYPLLGRIQDLSTGYLYSWQSFMSSPGTRRHFRPLFSLGVKVGSAYTIRSTTVLDVWDTVSNLVINCIVL